MKRLYFGILVAICLIKGSVSLKRFNLTEREPACESQIYCYGDLLHTVQMAELYTDSKNFVDMKLKYLPDITIEKFKEFMTNHNNNPGKEEIRSFVDENFEDVASEFENWIPGDWTESPKMLDNITDVDYKQWARDLNDVWKDLGRQMKADVHENPDYYSIIPVPNPVIVPGGRFREFYYWDSFWIVKGLLHSEMYTTTKGMLSNFLSIVDRFGFIPNGGRIYYSARSQPPLLAPMIDAYVEATKDTQFAISNIPTLEREFQYWLNNHMVLVNNHALAVYGDKSTGPRPESYSEDVNSAKIFDSTEQKEEFYAELKAAAESGMDFSSRWFVKDSTNKGVLTDLKCRSIVPVELNAILFWNAKIISRFYVMSGNLAKAAEYDAKAEEIYNAVQAVLWHDDLGTWLDYDLINNIRRDYFVPTNLSPLWTKCYNEANAANISEKVLTYINNNALDKYPGGVPNTFEETGEQWDYPNVWPPMQHILVEGLKNLEVPSAQEMSFKWASRWVRSNFIAYKETRNMYEKYTAEEMGGHGTGGEYVVQTGFGWSNGVIMDFLAQYGQELSSSGSTLSRSWKYGGIITTVLGVVLTVSAGFFG